MSVQHVLSQCWVKGQHWQQGKHTPDIIIDLPPVVKEVQDAQLVKHVKAVPVGELCVRIIGVVTVIRSPPARQHLVHHTPVRLLA